jgi:hypothetical protein
MNYLKKSAIQFQKPFNVLFQAAKLIFLKKLKKLTVELRPGNIIKVSSQYCHISKSSQAVYL